MDDPRSRLQDDLKTAMRAKDKKRRDTVRVKRLADGKLVNQIVREQLS